MLHLRKTYNRLCKCNRWVKDNLVTQHLLSTILKSIEVQYNKIYSNSTEISPRDSCFAQWSSSDESRDHCAMYT